MFDDIIKSNKKIVMAQLPIYKKDKDSIPELRIVVDTVIEEEKDKIILKNYGEVPKYRVRKIVDPANRRFRDYERFDRQRVEAENDAVVSIL